MFCVMTALRVAALASWLFKSNSRSLDFSKQKFKGIDVGTKIAIPQMLSACC